MNTHIIDWRRTWLEIEVSLSWRSRNNFMGRFGGGWNWKVGAQWSGRTLLVSLLVMELKFRKKGHDEVPDRDT